MPIYDYDCASCGRRSEIIHGVHADQPTVCPLCGGGPLRKAVTASAVHFKGSGWAKKERRPSPSKSGASSGSTGDDSSGGDAPSTDRKDGTSTDRKDGTSTDRKDGTSTDRKDGTSSASESTGASRETKSGGDAGASTATKPAAD
jgi:putative FmdB family regulatory protein